MKPPTEGERESWIYRYMDLLMYAHVYLCTYVHVYVCARAYIRVYTYILYTYTCFNNLWILFM